MANRYFLNIGANYGDTANWSDTDGGSGGFSVPTSSDDVFFTSNSGNCTVNTSTRACKAVNFTGYASTITFSVGLQVNGNITMSSSMSVSGSASMTLLVSATITCNTKVWNGVISFGGTNITVTLADILYVSGTINVSSTSDHTINGFSIYCSGSLYLSNNGASTRGTTVFRMTGTGDIGAVSTGIAAYFANPIIIDSSGTVTLKAGTLNTFRVGGGGSFTCLSGTISIGSVVFGQTVTGNYTMDLGAYSLHSYQISALATITLNSTLNVTNTVSIQSNTTFTGSFGFSTATFSCIVAGTSITFKNGITYTVNTTLTITGTAVSRISFVSSTTSHAFFTLNVGATQNVQNCNATWIDSSGGQTIRTSSGTLSNTINWITAGSNMFLVF